MEDPSRSCHRLEDDHLEVQYLEIVHWLAADTPIENGKRGQRLIALSRQTCNLLDDRLREWWPNVEDDHCRRSLLVFVLGRRAAR